ncbi:MAG: S1 RNA-binding domain-containing protein [Lachnospiraceae bacterium]|nr:S1 RNA-binding domain-containing protein [Lachnospiraceae bacterium]
MFELAKTQTLYVEKKVEFGYYLVSEDLRQKKVPASNEHVLLPGKLAPRALSAGEAVEVFVYLDSQDRPVATTAHPYVELHQTALLTVNDVSKVGAFLNWGLEKDLFLPFAEQTKPVKKGEEVLVGVYLDKSGRISSTMNVYPYLSSESPYKKGDTVTGRIYETSRNFGVFVAVDNKFQGLIPSKEVHGPVEIGSKINARITGVRSDGKLNLSVHEKSYLEIDKNAEAIMDLLDSYSGVLPFTEKATPEVIARETGLSKNDFKKAVGRLYKERKVTISEDGKIRRA